MRKRLVASFPPPCGHFAIVLGFSFLLGCEANDSTAQPPAESARDAAVQAMLERAREAELSTPYEPPPGDPLHHHASGYAKVLCSAVFITALEADFAAANIGFFSAPLEQRSGVTHRIDRDAKTVTVTLADGVERTARMLGDQGCVTFPLGASDVSFRPTSVPSGLPDPKEQPWPMGDAPAEAEDTGIDAGKVASALDAAFSSPEAMTAALVVTHRGQIVGERYRDGITKTTALESWSMGKSLTATLMGVLIQHGVYELDQPAPVPQWQEDPDDPRAQIRIRDLLQMSSGLRFRAPQDPDFDPALGYPDHLYVYTGPNAFEWAATRPAQWPPGVIGRYRNSDPVLVNYLIRLGVESRDESYHHFPQGALFDKLGVRTMVIETDAHGNFLPQGYEFASARDWARIGNLYLQDGVWEGERILPDGFVDFARTVAPAWEADGRPIYGGFFWINRDGPASGERRFAGVTENAYYMAGAGGQYTVILPEHGLVVARLGHYRGGAEGLDTLTQALQLLEQAAASN